MKLQRLRGRKTSELLRRKGSVWKGSTMTVRWLPGAPRSHPDAEGLLVGSFASTKLHKSAVKRNRMRRRIREAFRKSVREREKLPTLQLLLSPTSRSLTCDNDDIVTDVESFLSTVS